MPGLAERHGVQFYINGVLKTTHTTNIPTNAVNVSPAYIMTNEAVAKSIDIDFARIQVKGLSR